jgi:hypothetical protein
MHAQITLCKHVRSSEFVYIKPGASFLSHKLERKSSKRDVAYVPYRSTLIPHSARSDSELGSRRQETMDDGLLVCGSRYCVTSEMPYSIPPRQELGATLRIQEHSGGLSCMKFAHVASLQGVAYGVCM